MNTLRIALAMTVLAAFASAAGAATIVANTATTLPAKTFSFTGGIILYPNAGNFNFGGGLGAFGMGCMGLGMNMDVAVKYIYSDNIGLDLEYNLIKNKELINLISRHRRQLHLDGERSPRVNR